MYNCKNNIWKIYSLQTGLNLNTLVHYKLRYITPYSNLAACWLVLGSNHGRRNRFFSSVGGLGNKPFNGYWGSFVRVKQPENKVDHMLLASAKVKNEWRYTFSTPVCSHIGDRAHITLITNKWLNACSTLETLQIQKTKTGHLNCNHACDSD